MLTIFVNVKSQRNPTKGVERVRTMSKGSKRRLEQKSLREQDLRWEYLDAGPERKIEILKLLEEIANESK